MSWRFATARNEEGDARPTRPSVGREDGGPPKRFYRDDSVRRPGEDSAEAGGGHPPSASTSLPSSLPPPTCPFLPSASSIPSSSSSSIPSSSSSSIPSSSSSSIPSSSSSSIPSSSSYSGPYVPASRKKKLRLVEVDGLVLTKVLKHCRENYPTPVNGQLLGMDVGDKLEITNCFPLPQKRDVYLAVQKEKGGIIGAGRDDVTGGVDERVEEEFENYQDRMAELMHDLSVDCFTIGWYQTLSFGDLKNKDNLDSLVLYQELVDKAVMLGFDPLLNALGRMPLKAYRASQEFLSAVKACGGGDDEGGNSSSSSSSSRLNRLKGRDILVEVPIVVKNSLLSQCFLKDWVVDDPSQSAALFNALEIDQDSYLERNLSFLSECLDELGAEQDKIIKYQKDKLKQQLVAKQSAERRRLENEQRRLRGESLLSPSVQELAAALRRLEVPSQVGSLLLGSQVAAQCREVSALASENLAKLYLLTRGE